MANHLSKVPRFAGFGKEGRGEIFQCLCQFNFETLNKLSDSYLKIQSTVGAATVSTPKVYDESYRNRAGTVACPTYRFKPQKIDNFLSMLGRSKRLRLVRAFAQNPTHSGTSGQPSNEPY